MLVNNTIIISDTDREADWIKYVNSDSMSDEELMDLIPITTLKHLPGQHSQQSHDPTKGKGGSSSETMSQQDAAKILNDMFGKTPPNKQIADMLREINARAAATEINTSKAVIGEQDGIPTRDGFKNYTDESIKSLTDHYDLKNKCKEMPESCRDLVAYTENDHMALNKLLRGGEGNVEVLGRERQEKLANIDAAFDEFEVPENLVTFRGGGRTGNRLFEELEVGDSMIDNGYVSTSLDSRQAGKFTSTTFGEDNRTIVEIRVKKGQKGILLTDISGYPEESELLLPRDSKFKIIEKVVDDSVFGKGTNRLVMEMED